MAESKLVLLDFWASLYGMRCKIALAMKEIDYEGREEELHLGKKSPLLLVSNPIHRKVPVLIHDGRAISESRIIVEYIDEYWKDKAPLLPSDPSKRAQARFWVDYVDKTFYTPAKRVWRSKGIEHEELRKQLIQAFKVMEGVLGDKPFFGGDDFGFLDIVMIPFQSWLPAYETFGGFSLKLECPKLIPWAERCLQMESVSKSLTDPRKVFSFVAEFRKKVRFRLDAGSQYELIQSRGYSLNKCFSLNYFSKQ